MGRDVVASAQLAHEPRGGGDRDGLWAAWHGQFRSSKILRALARHGMVGSMGHVGSAGDNAAMEPFFALDNVAFDRRRWGIRDEIRIDIVQPDRGTYHQRLRPLSAA